MNVRILQLLAVGLLTIIFGGCQILDVSEDEGSTVFCGEGTYWAAEFKREGLEAVLVITRKDPVADYVGTVSYSYDWLHKHAVITRDQKGNKTPVWDGPDNKSGIIRTSGSESRQLGRDLASLSMRVNLAGIDPSEMADIVRITIEWDDGEEVIEAKRIN